MHTKRLKLIGIVLYFSFIIIAIRVLYIQFVFGQKYSAAAAAQRTDSQQVFLLRGNFLDRSGIPFTDRSKSYYAIIKALLVKNDAERIKSISELLGIQESLILRQLELNKATIMVEIDEIKAREITTINDPAISVINSLKRYSEGALATHVIGYIKKADAIGESGLEKYFQSILNFGTSYNIGVVTDAKNNVIMGIGYRKTKIIAQEDKQLNVKLTLDYHIQKIVEEVMDEMDITGAAVLLDVNTGDILAMASKPDFDQNDVASYLYSEKNELFNRATASYNLGSIFKIIDLAAFLEDNMNINDEIICNGSTRVGDREIKCSAYNTGGHGSVNMIQAFVQSCNTYFIEKSIILGAEKLLDMAQKFGLGQLTGINNQGVFETSGNLPDPRMHINYGDIANMSIGQGVMLATPVQVADIVATIANGGIKNKVNIVDCLLDTNNNIVRSIKVKKGQRIIDKHSADNIKSYMEAVTKEGTGIEANIDEYGGAGGKTGSAQTGSQGETHAWFAGYFPARAPKYSLCIFVENGKFGGKAAAPIFAEIAKRIIVKGY